MKNNMKVSSQQPMPKWLQISDQYLLTIIEHTVASLEERQDVDPEYKMPPLFAALHLHQAIRASIRSNSMGHHSVAIALIRQCVESLTIIEIGLQKSDFMKTLIDVWRKDQGHGELRKKLQSERWSSYGNGVWDEPWEEFFGNLAMAVQPYAHYTQYLMGWQYITPPVIKNNNDTESLEFSVTYGLDDVDKLKLLRIQILQALVGWTLARLLEENGIPCPMRGDPLRKWANEIRSSELFDDENTNLREHWKDQLLPFTWFTVDDWKP